MENLGVSVEVRAESESGQCPISEEEATPSGRLDCNLLNTLANILRHGDLGWATASPGGYLFVEEILKGHPGFAGYSLPDIHKLVKVGMDKRFALMRDIDSGCWKIRANRGHSLVEKWPKATGFTREFDRKAITERNIPLYKEQLSLTNLPSAKKSHRSYRKPQFKMGSPENIGTRVLRLPTPTVTGDHSNQMGRQWDPGIPPLQNIKTIQVKMENEGGSAQSPRVQLRDLQPFSVQGLGCIKRGEVVYDPEKNSQVIGFPICWEHTV
ncbi:unnamed protein product [Mytilus coruscus]|uniref:TRPT1 n=1 Tax=Mytilus coruscus TaxID=42192 RepID=A0A6J8EPG2_MYTCO|nr:unnamed protein product [Mytilus coruscus]